MKVRETRAHRTWRSRLAALAMSEVVPGESCTNERVVVVGATGYIGKAVVRWPVNKDSDI